MKRHPFYEGEDMDQLLNFIPEFFWKSPGTKVDLTLGLSLEQIDLILLCIANEKKAHSRG